MDKIVKVIFSTIVLTLFYFVWTRTTNVNNLLVTGILALAVSIIYRNYLVSPILHPKKIGYSLFYVIILFVEIVKSNIDVAFRVIKPVIPINPGIVTVKTKLKSRMGRLILTNSITLTPGTLTVDMIDDTLYIHWIDVKDKEETGATEKIVSNFEKYLEVIFG
ncbi:TPA: Na+/H+ antiporter subunit E [Candidatus Delongbacteria bacterium]|nr:MAG: hypothetical protein A2Y39_00210 [Candidatus Delongbacteria bacterium GWF2_40_14]HAQ60410.1 Na+/H+ antiporter subunit E [Candidatus Delongbacteria bacterium]